MLWPNPGRRDFGFPGISRFSECVRRSPLLPIFLVVLVDILGFAMVYPLLPFYAEHFGATPLVATTLVSVYALCSLFSTPVIGRLSDQFGRRRLLLISQAGTCAGFIMLGFSSSLWMVFLGRILDGVTAGNLSTAQAYISDHTKPENRAKAFGIIGIAFGIGFTFGPVMAGWLQHRYNTSVPFLVAAGLSAGSMICTYTLLAPGVPGADSPEPASGPPAAAAPVAPGGRRPAVFDLGVYLDYFKRPGLGSLYLQFFLYIFSFSAFMSGFALFAERQFTWTAHEVGFLFGYTGFLGIIVQGGLLGRLVKQLGEVKLAITGFVAIVIAYVALGFTTAIVMLVGISTISAFGNGVLRPTLTALLSQRVGRHEQGIALGISASLSSLAMTLAPPVGGVLLTQHWLVAWAMVPATAAALGLIVALVNRSAASKVPPPGAAELPRAVAKPVAPTP